MSTITLAGLESGEIAKETVVISNASDGTANTNIGLVALIIVISVIGAGVGVVFYINRKNRI